ncbi:hypothetical protein Cme02nite_56670 [Catellatospora methionotrophica]|uniref:MafI family immunity protein n=1 Tax=Catellatospora methionotrophica TaxID=121620 RepID=A0A8J3LML9_9ACTN|nr:hypothetical protein Cme02nite_56670 [Catellatospora methionotrophica]
MERYVYLRSLITALLEDSPLTREEVIEDVRHLMSVGEEELAFYTMCSWLYEDALSITSSYYKRLVFAADELGTPESIRKLDELIEG